MSAKVTRLFGHRQPAWVPAPDRTTIPLPRLTIAQQLAPHPPQAAPAAAADLTTPEAGAPEQTEVIEPMLASVEVAGPAVDAASQRQRLRQANELLRTFTISA